MHLAESRQHEWPLDRPFTPAEAQTRGLTRDVLGRLTRDGLLRRIVKGVYVDAAVPDALALRAAALALVVPETAIVTDRTAAWLHGVSLLQSGDHLTTPPVSLFQLPGCTRVRTRCNVGGERTLLSTDIETVATVRVTTPLRTALDLGRLLSRDDALAGLDAMLGTDHFTSEELLSEVPRFRGHRGVVQLRELAPLADGRAESPPESVLRLRWLDAGLPKPEPQHWIRNGLGVGVYRVDVGCEAVPYAAEYDGEEFHSSPDQRAHDEARRRWIRARGTVVDVFDKADVYGSPVRLMSRLQLGLRAAGG